METQTTIETPKKKKSKRRICVVHHRVHARTHHRKTSPNTTLDAVRAVLLRSPFNVSVYEPGSNTIKHTKDVNRQPSHSMHGTTPLQPGAHAQTFSLALHTFKFTHAVCAVFCDRD